MAGREVREYTNLTDPKGTSNFFADVYFFHFFCILVVINLLGGIYADKKSGKGKDRIDDEEITFQRMVAKVRESSFSFFHTVDSKELNLSSISCFSYCNLYLFNK